MLYPGSLSYLFVFDGLFILLVFVFLWLVLSLLILPNPLSLAELTITKFVSVPSCLRQSCRLVLRHRYYHFPSPIPSPLIIPEFGLSYSCLFALGTCSWDLVFFIVNLFVGDIFAFTFRRLRFSIEFPGIYPFDSRKLTLTFSSLFTAGFSTFPSSPLSSSVV